VAEVFRRLMAQRGIEAALRATAAMQRQGTVIELDASLARDAGRLGVELKIPMADSIVYATARALEGVVWTQDSDFENLPHVRYWPKVQ
jgi:predicted nucleic acid-binding protein